MKDKHFFNVGQEKEGVIFLEFSVKCTDCDASLVHKMEFDHLETARLAVELVNRLGVSEELGQAFAKIVSGGKISAIVDADMGIFGDSKLNIKH